MAAVLHESCMVSTDFLIGPAAPAGDFAAFPSGTGICHTFINDGAQDAVLLSGGDADTPANRLYYPLNLERRSDRDMPCSRWWDDVPQRPRGPLDGKPRPK